MAPPEKHLITIAPTGAGKFRSVLAPELLTYPGPIVCVDIKGEAYAVTARRRRELGQRVVRLDPFEVVGPSSDSLNFFDLFRLPNADLETEAQMISSILAGGASLAKAMSCSSIATCQNQDSDHCIAHAIRRMNMWRWFVGSLDHPRRDLFANSYRA